MSEIDATCSERFLATFEKVNTVFEETFAHLFGGGTARMELVDEDDPLESGLDIVAQPPGKKNQSVQLLSGGEKALTALALLIALFRIKPSPFCILDEVDAPLDDANVERLAELVQTMTEHDPVRDGHPQPPHDAARRRALRGDDGGARRLEGRFRQARGLTLLPSYRFVFENSAPEVRDVVERVG